MQVTRALRCFRGPHPLRKLLFRTFDDILKKRSPVGQQQLCECEMSLVYFRARLYSSTSESSRNKESSITDSQTEQISKTSALDKDNFDISDLENKIISPNSSELQNMLVELRKEVEKASDGKRVTDTWNKIQPQLHKAVNVALQDTSLPELRLKCLRILLISNEDSDFLHQILTQTVKDAHFVGIKTIADIVHLLTVNKETPLRKTMRRNLVLIMVNNRWFEIGPKQIVFFLYQLDELFNMKDVCLRNRKNDDALADIDKKEASTQEPVSINNLEKRLISLIDEIKPKDLARVVSLMGKWRNRNQILLLALVHRLSLADMSDFTLIQLSNFLFACSILSLHSPAVLEKAAEELSNRELSSSALVSSLLSSLSYLRWNSSSFVSKCLDFIDTNKHTLSSRDCWSILMSMANLYALPTSDKQIAVIKAIGQKGFDEAKSNADKVDIAWCLAVLKLLDESMAKTVLEPNFVQAFNVTDDNNFQNKSSLQKLRGINLMAKFELEGYEGPLMADHLFSFDAAQERSAAQNQLVSVLTNTLGKFVDMASYVGVSQSLPGGLYADAVMCSGPDGSPKPLADLDKEPASSSFLQKLAIQVIPFNGVLTSHPFPCGVHQMASRHLRHLGYAAVQIPYSDLRESQSVLEHVNAIQSLIKKAVVCNGGAS